MRAIRCKDTEPEMVIRRMVHKLGYRFRLHRRDLPGKPDIVFPKLHSIIFVNGCFWHKHKGCKYATVPKSNVAFWTEKLKRNVQRDKENIRALKKQGYRVNVLWECETTNIKRLNFKLRKFLDNKK